MKIKVTQLFSCGKFLLALVTVVFVLAACKSADSSDGGTSNPPPVTPTTYTVTIDANTGSLGDTKSISDIQIGATVPLAKLVSPPTKTDYEIVYWSKSPDNFDDPFEFDITPVNGNITIYPHWRYTLAKVRSLLNGDWDVLPLKDVFRVRDTNANSSSCDARDYTTFPSTIYDIGSRSDLINAYRSFPTALTLVESSFVGNISVVCRPSAYELVLNDYTGKNSTDITINGFVYFSITKTDTTSIILSSSDDYKTNFSIKVTGGADAGTYTGTRIP